jgi:hypothetical protein
MNKFMLILREDLERFGKITEEERLQMAPVMMKWIESIASTGKYVTGGPLATRGAYVRKNEVMSDGPFIESKEGISGYDIILAEDLEEAIAVAQTCPVVVRGWGAREVRPIIFVNSTKEQVTIG